MSFTEFPLILTEGPDNAGKSALAHDLAKRLKGIYLKTERHPRFSPDVCAYQDLLRQARLLAPTLVDRHPAISEPIYGRIIRGEHCLERYPGIIDDCLRQFSLIVYCRPPRHIISDSIADRPQMDGVHEHLEAIIDAYDTLFQGLTIQAPLPFVFTYNYQAQSPDDIMNYLLDVVHPNSRSD
jgi:hypothetical protein